MKAAPGTLPYKPAQPSANDPATHYRKSLRFEGIAGQLDRCQRAHRVPTARQIRQVAADLPEARGLVVVDINERAAVVAGLATEQPRHPHRERRQGRADIGWKDGPEDG
jgi:hypothetical protein